MTTIFDSKRELRAAIKHKSIEELERLIKNLNEILGREKERDKAKLAAAKKAKIAKIKALMAESGLSPEDLKGGAKRGRPAKKSARSNAKKAKRKVAPKYRLLVDGTEYLWSGRGRPPKVFKEYMDAGNSKESCAI
ncbi:MAG: H-NS histone family protein [Pseudomonadota bacterium]